MLTEYSDKIHLVNNFTPCADISGRDFWDSLPGELRQELIRNGEASSDFDWKRLLASDYMEFSRTGDRTRYENIYNRRRCALDHLVLAECVENKGRFLDDILNGIYCILEESTWCIPAHNSMIRDAIQDPLPDYASPVIDIFSGETAAILALTEYLLRPALAKISPLISQDIDFRLRERIFVPYMKYHFWWMGDGESQMNNWTVWITQNILLAAFTRPDAVLDRKTKDEIIKRSIASINYFLDEYGEDGCCDEGAQYYSLAALSLYSCLEILDHVTGHVLCPVFTEPMIRNIADYIRKVHITGKYYVNFADCSPLAGRRSAREYLFGKRAHLPELCAFAASDFRADTDRLLSREMSLYRRLLQIICWEELMSASIPCSFTAENCYFESTGLMTARDETLFLAVKAGDNGDSHNHNDVGSFMIYHSGRPLFIDLGVETYCRKTFSPGRYDIWTMQSQYHNLPSFGGFLQQAGADFAACKTACTLTPTLARISMELAGAYRQAGSGKGCVSEKDGSIRHTDGADALRSFQRTVTFFKHDRIVIEDVYDSTLPAVLNLMTCELPSLTRIDRERHLLSFPGGGTCRICGALSAQIESIPLTDPRLSACWGSEVYRIRLEADSRIELEIR